MKQKEENHLAWAPLIANAVSGVYGGYRRLPREDLMQEAYAWWYAKSRYVSGVINNVDLDEDDKSRLLYVAIRAHLRGLCAKDKASRLGFEIRDLFYYTPSEIRVLLDKLYDRPSWLEKGTEDGVHTKSDPAVGGNALAVMVDLAKGVAALPEKEQVLLRERHLDKLTIIQIGKLHEITEDAARRRYDRAIDRLHRNLGGDRPTWDHVGPGARKAASNAAAQARTHFDLDAS